MNSNRTSLPTHHEGKGRFGPRGFLNFQSPGGIIRWYPLLLILITLGVFFQSISHEFTYDDYPRVLEDPLVRQSNITALWDLGGNILWHRQVRTLTYMVDYALFGISPVGYHLHNLFWHTLCVVLVFVLLKKLTHQATFSFFGALIFAIHPIHVEAVSNIANRKELLALGFLLIAFLCYIRFLERETAKKWVWLCLGVCAWGLGIFSKQVAMILPLLLVAYEFLLVPKDQRFLTKNTPLLVSLLGAATISLVLYAFSIWDMAHDHTPLPGEHSVIPQGYRGELTYLALVATSARAFWTYIQLLVWPAGLCPEHIVDYLRFVYPTDGQSSPLACCGFLLVLLQFRTGFRQPTSLRIGICICRRWAIALFLQP
jgi:4-amino-4-deoxy-L-arabinose transferase-like glycosyltransferase